MRRYCLTPDRPRRKNNALALKELVGKENHALGARPLARAARFITDKLRPCHVETQERVFTVLPSSGGHHAQAESISIQLYLFTRSFWLRFK
jgi:hypothetical protein